MPSAIVVGQGGNGGGGGSSNASVGANAASAPGSSTEIGIIVAGLLQPISSINPLPVNNTSVGVIGDLAPLSATFIGVVNSGGDLEGVGASNPIRVDPTGTTVQPVEGTGIAGAPSTSVLSVQGEIGMTPFQDSFYTVEQANAINQTWTSASVQNSLCTANTIGFGNILFSVVITGTITGGVITFEISPDGTNWIPLLVSQSGAEAESVTTYSLAGGTQLWQMFIGGAYQARMRLSTVISGTGSVSAWARPSVAGTEFLQEVFQPLGSNLHMVIDSGAVAAESIYNATPPAPATTTSLPLQADYEGSLFVKPYRRSQTVAQATTIATSTAATTILAAQAAGVFADITDLVITVVPGATVSTAFLATLSDGTNTYIYSLSTGALATVPAPSNNLDLDFDPPLPATTAATVWTLTLSSNTPTIYVTVIAALQKAS